MELREFVRTAIVDVLNAVMAVQQATRKGKGRVATGKTTAFALTPFEFDIALSSTGESAEKAGLGVLLAGVGIGGQAEHKETDLVTSRLKFTIPVQYPHSYYAQGDISEITLEE